jgi:rhodanese-related sulfurtransferase
MSECTVLGLKEKIGEVKTTLLDVREEVEFAGERISGAKLIPLNEVEKRHKEIDHTHTVYVVCRSGRRSLEAQNRLMFAVESKSGKKKIFRLKKTKTHLGH